jgi:hypothetical protein
VPFSDICLQENHFLSNPNTSIGLFCVGKTKSHMFSTTTVDYKGKILINNKSTIQR